MLINLQAPRVPPHGLQVFHPESETSSVPSNSYLANVQAVPRIQDLLRDSLPTTPPQAVPKQKSVQRRNTFVKNNETPSSSICENSQRYHYRNKSNAAAQANCDTIKDETSQCLMENDIVGGGGIIESIVEQSGEMKPSERLEQCINSMMKKAEMLHPSPAEQIIQKQQILEELQKVERELQEKAHHQYILSTQNQQHHQNLRTLGTIITGAPTITAVSNTTANSFTSVPGGHTTQPLLINSGTVLDIESLSDISSVSSQLGLHFPITTNPNVTHAQQQMVYQNRLRALQEQQQQNSVTTTTLASDYCKSRAGKPVKQAKSNVMKQMSQQLPYQLQSEIKIDPQSHPDGMEKINLHNIVMNEQQQQQIQLQQQLLQQHSQQQFVLSEFTQNLTLRGTQYCEGAIAGIMHAMKLTTDSTQTPNMPMYDPVTVGQALLQQQHQQLSQVIQQETKRQQQSQQPQQQQQMQSSNQQQHHFEKNVKLLKGKTNKVQQSHLHTNQQSAVTTLQQSSQAQPILKQQLAAACQEAACTLVGSIPIDGTGVLTLSGMAAQTFPVSIAVSPVSLSSPVSISTNCGTSFTHNLSLDEGLMVAAPARTLHETLGDIMSGKLEVLIW
ncbi:ankyrin repeat domain-containing protein 17 [Trichonephila clavipes]|nr:ankyrin repeat domain-containing protein 17 [Trichonephila clavipes]